MTRELRRDDFVRKDAASIGALEIVDVGCCEPEDVSGDFYGGTSRLL
jgi:hypothetical protein